MVATLTLADISGNLSRIADETPCLGDIQRLMDKQTILFMSIPDEQTEAAIVDGANAPTILLRIILPLSLPVIATIGLFYAVYHWNAWFDAAIYIDRSEIQPLQIILRGLLRSATLEGMEEISFMEKPPPAASLRSALIIVSTVPVLFIYPFIQRYFVKGIMIGGVKG